MKVTANENFKHYRNAVLGLDLKDFRALQKGKIVDIPQKVLDKCPAAFIETKELKDGSTNKPV